MLFMIQIEKFMMMIKMTLFRLILMKLKKLVIETSDISYQSFFFIFVFVSFLYQAKKWKHF